MRNHRRAGLAALTAVFLLSALAGPADAHLRKKNGDRVSKKHARWHKKQKAQQEATAVASTELPAAGAAATGRNLEQYEATVDGATLQELVSQGYDVTPMEDTVDGTRVVLVLSAGERDTLQAKGISLDRFGGRATRAALQEDGEFEVFRSWDEPGGIEDELRQIGRTPQYRGFLRLYDIGNSIEGRDILAIRMTQGARGLPLGTRPAVLYQGTTHAREWISTEMTMRLLNWFIQERRAENPEIVDLVETTELWFVPVVNPDGYEYTFDVERLWRKNLRDNDGNGIINNSDGVDVNRNYPEHWNYDNEGSSSAFSSETYRGTGPASEPENQANIQLVEDMGDFKFAISYHSFGELLLYTQGWQVLTPSADDAIYMALTGDDDNPAVEGYDPGVGADLYTTNGEFTDWAHGEAGVLAWTPEMEGDGFGFVFPDDEGMIQAEFERNLDFAINVGMSATDPDDPQSHWGVDTDELYLDLSELDPWKTNWPSSDLRVDVSYAGGSSQPVEVLAKRAIGAITLHYKINGGSEQTALNIPESPDGEVFGGNNAYDVYYHYLRGEIPGLSMGDSVEYWFSGGGESTDHVTFEVEGDATADVLIVAAEDRTGGSNTPPYGSTSAATPNFLSHYTDAVTATGRTVEIYDVDAMGREAPDHLGVLNHYDAVVWYTGNDFVTREPGYSAGNVSRLAVDMVLEHRAYLNEGGDLLYTGQRAGATENGLAGGQFYDPVANEPCLRLVIPPDPEEDPFLEETEFFHRCLLWSDKNDFIQYYLGGFIYNSLGDPGTTTEVEGTDTPYAGTSWFLNGSDSANNQNHHASFITTSSILPTYPHFTSDARAGYAAAGPSPFEPFDGDWYMYSNQADITYKRLMRTFDLTEVSAADAPTLTFRFSYDTEPAWDFVFVEGHTVGQDDWTTVPDQNGHTTNDTGESCPAGWHELHPWLERYQTFVPPPDGDSPPSCEPTGTTGNWNAHSGRSDGWEEWVIDLSDYAGSEVELSISYASDWAIQGLGSFVDAVEVTAGGSVLHETSFEEDADPMDGWTVPGAPEGSAQNPNDWERTQDVGFEEGAIVSMTPTGPNFTTLYAGFGFEAIRGADTRRDVMEASLDFLGV